MPYVFDFDHNHARPPMELKDLLGGKGANLAEMTSVLALPVPPGFTISTDACRDYMAGGWPKSLDDEVARARTRLEKAMDKVIGDPDDPLLVSVRSGAKFSMPGMMDTVLNLGLNDHSVEGLAKQTGDERFAFDSYRRFIAMYGRIVLELPGEEFDSLFDAAKELAGTTSDAKVPVELLRYLVDSYQQIVERHTKEPFPQDPADQLRGAIEAVFRSWNGPRAIAYRNRERIAHDLGTAVNVQAMVFGNRDDNSGTGVGFTRDPATGAKGAYGDFLVNAQGEDVVAGIRNTEPISELKKQFPAVHKELLAIFARLEGHYKDMCDTEFTIDQGKLWMLQTRVGKRTGAAALKMAVDMARANDLGISKAEAVSRITEDHLDSVLHPQFAGSGYDVWAKGLGASPGAAVGRIYFTANDAAAAAERGEKVVLVRSETSPEDVHGMLASEGILTARGGLVSHAAVVARGWGKPAVVGAEVLRLAPHSVTVGDVTLQEGDWVSLDGGAGIVVAGQVPLTAASPLPAFKTVLSWADEIRKGHLAVRANADTGEDAANARSLGAEGIGLCRTEHMFLGEDRLPVVRRMILADTPEDETAALEELRKVQREDFIEILAAMDGLPVTVRLLDPPLHEFLPSTEELAIKEATVGLDPEERRLYAAALSWKEANPMLGTRGVRLGVVKPGLYAMQVRALMEAARQRVADGVAAVAAEPDPRPSKGAARSQTKAGALEVTIGTMIETPRAALLAGEIAEEADFFSFGTNDLTQMTFGFSRDDVEGRMMGAYLELGLLKRNPFDVVDADGVGELVRLGTQRGRATRPNLKVGVCGEHGGDPESITLFYDAGLDYVSCSPFRVPVARLAAAQAVLAAAPPAKAAPKATKAG
jgi:pyruvate,orthophosphate dikinase